MGTAQFEEYISEHEEELEHFEDGEMAELCCRIDNRVIKILSNRKGREHAIPNILDLNEPMFSKENKSERIADITEAQEDLQFSFPEIIHREDEFLEVEYVEGTKLNEHFENAGMDEIEQSSRKIGEYMKELHQKGWAVRDFDPDNIIIDRTMDGEEFYIVDTELSKRNPKLTDRLWDVASFLYNADPGEQEKYDEIVESFSEGYELNGAVEKNMQPFLGIEKLITDRDYEESSHNFRRRIKV